MLARYARDVARHSCVPTILRAALLLGPVSAALAVPPFHLLPVLGAEAVVGEAMNWGGREVWGAPKTGTRLLEAGSPLPPLYTRAESESPITLP